MFPLITVRNVAQKVSNSRDLQKGKEKGEVPGFQYIIQNLLDISACVGSSFLGLFLLRKDV